MLLTLLDRHGEQEQYDIEIPKELTAGLFKEYWVKGTGGEEERLTGSYLVEGREPGGSWFGIPDHLAFSESGLQTGAFIRIKAVYSTAELPEGAEASLPLFHTRSM